MKQIELLEQELKMVQENLQRLKDYKKEAEAKHQIYNCHVFGEFKHRLIALKQRITLVNKLSTYDYLTN